MIEPMPEAERKPRRGRRRWTAGALVAIVAGVAFAIYLSSRDHPPPPPQLPVPNGYDDLVAAGRMVDGLWPKNGDFAKAEPAEIRPFLEAHRDVLIRARVGLGRECMVPLDDSQASFSKHVAEIGPIRSVGRMFLGEARVAEADGRIADASRGYRSMLALGLAAGRGGVGIDQMVGGAIHYQAIAGLRSLCGRLPREEIAALLPELESVDRNLASPDAVEARWSAWYRGSQSPWMRVMMRLNGLEKSTRAEERSIAERPMQKTRRDLRFLGVMLAIRAHHLDKGTWPRSLGDLVPTYLAAVPVDPATGDPLTYPANPDGELTDDLTSIARPDGEVVSPKP